MEERRGWFFLVVFFLGEEREGEEGRLGGFGRVLVSVGFFFS